MPTEISSQLDGALKGWLILTSLQQISVK